MINQAKMHYEGPSKRKLSKFEMYSNYFSQICKYTFQGKNKPFGFLYGNLKILIKNSIRLIIMYHADAKLKISKIFHPITWRKTDIDGDFKTAQNFGIGKYFVA